MSNFGFWSENRGLFADPSVIARLASWSYRSPSEQVLSPNE